MHFVPGFPVMAWPMIEWVLDQRYAHLHGTQRQTERSVIVFGAMEATLTPLMEAIEARFAGVKVFSLPSVDHPAVGPPHRARREGRRRPTSPRPTRPCCAGLRSTGAQLGPEMVR